jgi:hypothetical protein
MKTLSLFMSESLQQDDLTILRSAYPAYDFRLVKSTKFKDAYITSLYKDDKYIAGLRGPVSYDNAIQFFKNEIQQCQ